MKRVSKTTLLLTMALIIAALAAGCASPAPATPTPTAPGQPTPTPTAPPATGEAYVVQFSPFTSYTGLGTALGIEKGFFAEDGLEIEDVQVEDKVAAFISGEIDFADMNTSSAILAVANGAPFKIVGSMFRTKGAFYLLGASDIESIEDLRGKVVGNAYPGSGMDAYTRVILKENGLDPDNDVTLLANGAYAQAYASLEAKQVAATIIHQPYVALAESQGLGKLLAKGYEYLPTFHTGVLVASDEFIAGHPDELRKIIAAYYKSWTYAKENLDETVEFGKDYIGNIDADVLKSALESELVIWDNKPGVNVDALNDTQDIQIELGFQDEKWDVKPYIDERFLPEE